MRRLRLVATLFLALALTRVEALADSAFSLHSRDNDPVDVRAALAKLRPVAPDALPLAGRPMAYLVTADRGLIGFDLSSGKVVFKEAAAVHSRVVVSRGLIAYRQADGAIAARDPISGALKWTERMPEGAELLGLAGDLVESRIYYVYRRKNGSAAGFSSTVGALGQGSWKHTIDGFLGAPAAYGGLVGVPFAHQSVSILDGRKGSELARIRATDEQITYISTEHGDGFLYGGPKTALILDEKSSAGSRAQGATSVQTEFGSALAELNPFYSSDGYEPSPFDFGAYDRNHILYRVAPRTSQLADGRIYLHSFRFLFGLDQRGALSWVHSHSRSDLIASSLNGSVIVYASADGEVGVVDSATGVAQLIGKVEERLLGAAFDASGLSPALAPLVPVSDRVDALENIVWDHDARLGAVKLYAVSLLGALSGADVPAATRVLVKIVVAEKGISAAVQKRAGDELVRRKDAQAVPLYLDALKLHFDYLEDRHPNGVDALARTLAALSVNQAVPLIAAHLLDHETPQSTLKELATALGVLGVGNPEAKNALIEFFLAYRSDPLFIGDSSLSAAAEAILKVGGIAGRRTVSFAASDPRTLSALAVELTQLLDSPQKPKASAVKK